MSVKPINRTVERREYLFQGPDIAIWGLGMDNITCAGANANRGNSDESASPVPLKEPEVMSETKEPTQISKSAVVPLAVQMQEGPNLAVRYMRPSAENFRDKFEGPPIPRET